ncbi:hypothetical protein [Cohnella sp. JJ-181]|uniref:hypothetical protein n=1 Tax=Cohnella rhizoplanae TaxID=2974897 RepID=UPI0022FF6EF8|nr:hypothetical protein [Cohnella sp. JJ-181]CAI6081172.1 hypothetical protein COHCIP112018_03221 [Cohnella sp. JJ-181]
MLSEAWRRYEPFIRGLPLKERYDKADLLVPDTLLEKKGEVEIYYAPHAEYANRAARLLIVGLTPGWQQTELAYRSARLAFERGASGEEASREAKLAARFAGSMRVNLIGMLDALGLGPRFGTGDAAALFNESNEALHTMAMLPHPVFAAGKNYTGHQPPLSPGSFLYELAVRSLRDELSPYRDALVIPLGKSVELVCRQLEAEGALRGDRCLWGFPHPSGANGHRHAQFERGRPEMLRIIAELA